MARKSQRGAGSGCSYRNKPKSLKKSRKSQRGGDDCHTHKKPHGQNGGVCGGKHDEKNRQRGSGRSCGHIEKNRQRGGAYGRGHSHGYYKNTPKKLSRKRRTSLKRKSLVVCGPEGCNGQRK